MQQSGGRARQECKMLSAPSQVKKLGFHEKPLKSFIQGSDSDLILMFSKDPFGYLWRMDSGKMKMEARRPVREPPQHSK